MQKVTVNKGKKKASIAIPEGFTIKDIVDSMSKSLKFKQQDEFKQKFSVLLSVNGSEDKKKIIFEFKSISNEKNQIYFNFIDRNFYDSSDKIISEQMVKSNLDFEKCERHCKDFWVKCFFYMLSSNESFEFPEISLKSHEKIVEIYEKLCKLEVCQKLIKIMIDGGSYASDKNIFVFNFNVKKFDIKKTIADYEWIVNNLYDEAWSINWFYKCEGVDRDVFKYAFENYKVLIDFQEESIPIDKLVKMGYEPKRLVDYICRDLPNQGFTTDDMEDDACSENFWYSCDFIYDYANMSNSVSKDNYDRYPRYLKTYHDVAAKNFNLAKNTLFKNKFKNIASNFVKYEYSNEIYSVVRPQKAEDLSREGSVLNHCVASYVERVAEESTVIMFLRKNSDITTPFVTLEIQKNKVRQSSGKNNSRVGIEESKFLKDYEKHLGSVK
jgi:PcfJ-like protein